MAVIVSPHSWNPLDNYDCTFHSRDGDTFPLSLSHTLCFLLHFHSVSLPLSLSVFFFILPYLQCMFFFEAHVLSTRLLCICVSVTLHISLYVFSYFITHLWPLIFFPALSKSALVLIFVFLSFCIIYSPTLSVTFPLSKMSTIVLISPSLFPFYLSHSLCLFPTLLLLLSLLKPPLRNSYSLSSFLFHFFHPTSMFTHFCLLFHELYFTHRSLS